MKLIFPILPDSLPEKDLAEAFSPDVDDIRGMLFSGQTMQALELRGCDVDQCRFTNCRFIRCRLENFRFGDVVFESCDLSNLQLPDFPFSRWCFKTASYPAQCFPVRCSATPPFYMWLHLIQTFLEADGKTVCCDPAIFPKPFSPSLFFPLWRWRKAALPGRIFPMRN